jgi:hypothetical protein
LLSGLKSGALLPLIEDLTPIGSEHFQPAWRVGEHPAETKPDGTDLF